ncbi:toxin-antitoxin system YwqK family antitoxin [Saccharicrinis fermentans]|uniref:MORN repeat variant n=1 Tax=Saccharicrinis fermentans DSM 9555 = JCM 21142 TaxID=869213 RepID=W7YBU4_9BACT|nr:hypothetical protein [Saccharicrinis fermentans]GAF05917.1 hypothetical protein JCM21142_124676 [Saccharicrinis fermentans DSM 9555 = JCM 21142]
MKLLFLSVCAFFLTINAHSQMVNDADTLIIEEIILLDTGDVVLMPEFIEDYNIGYLYYNEPKMYVNTKGLYINVDSTLLTAYLNVDTTEDTDILTMYRNDNLSCGLEGKMIKRKKRKKELPFIDIHDSFSEFGESNFLTGRLEGNVIKGKKEGLWIEHRSFESEIALIHIKNMNYINGLLDGKYCVFNNQGDTLGISLFKQGTGNYVDFYSTSGVLKEKGQLVNGKKEGRWYFYDEEGELIKSSIYKNDYCITQ